MFFIVVRKKIKVSGRGGGGTGEDINHPARISDRIPIRPKVRMLGVLGEPNGGRSSRRFCFTKITIIY